MHSIETEVQLEDALSAPNAGDVETMRRLEGDVLVIGAGGKMGPSLARRIKRASEAAASGRRVIAVSRYSSPQAREELEASGVETIACDILDRKQIETLPLSENVFFLAGRKFGSTARADITWAINSYAPGVIADRYSRSRIVAFSTGNVYPFVSPASGGSIETDAPMPQGEYAQSCLGRERIFEYFSYLNGTAALIFRLNYAVDLRYGVLVDIARKVYDGKAVDLAVGHFNVIWQGDANSYALRALEVCESPPRILNVTGPETISVRQAAEFFARAFDRDAVMTGTELETALLSNASQCHSHFGAPVVSSTQLMEWVAHWITVGGASLGKPTHFEVTDGRY
ncbi:MAG: NAD-dependent epimerase/dehydratase family protein [Acidobacteriota bacterium]